MAESRGSRVSNKELQSAGPIKCLFKTGDCVPCSEGSFFRGREWLYKVRGRWGSFGCGFLSIDRDLSVLSIDWPELISPHVIDSHKNKKGNIHPPSEKIWPGMKLIPSGTSTAHRGFSSFYKILNLISAWLLQSTDIPVCDQCLLIYVVRFKH